MGNNNLLVQNIKNILGTIQHTISYNYDKTLKVSLLVSELYDAVCLLSNNSMLSFDILTDIVGVDNLLRKEKRFEVIYILTSINNRERIMLSVAVSEGEAIPSLSTSFDGANWLEREVWDMFGIPFSNHPDLRRLLSDYGFRGHPLRKDFPLYGYVETRYDEETKKVIYEPVFLEQDFRNFETQSPWEGVPLAGDEKANVNLEGKE